MSDVSLSVIIPTYNRPDLLCRAVSSVLATLPERSEILVIDDSSTLPTAGALQPLIGPDTPLRILPNPGERGPAAARNAGVAAARGRIVLFLDDDDLMLRGYPQTVLAAGASTSLPRWGFSPVLTHTDPETEPVDARGVAEGSVLAGPATRRHLAGLGCGFWVERELFQLAGGLSADLRVNEDTDLCLRLLALGHWPWRCNEPGVSVLERNPGAQGAESVTQAATARDRADYFKAIRERNAGLLAKEPKLSRFILRRHLKMLVRSGNWQDSLAIIRSDGNAADLFHLVGYLIAERIR